MSPPPRVAFDLTPLISGRTGIARYVGQVRQAMDELDVELRPFAVGRSAFLPPPGTRHVRLPARLLDGWWKVMRRPYIEQLAGPAELVHATGLFLPSTRLPLVVTVHDLGALRQPGLHPARQVRQQQVLLGKLEEAAAILAVSSTVADDLAALGVDRRRIVVTPLGLTPLPAPPPGSPAPSAGYLLTVGETSARKGYAVLLEALARLDGKPDLVMVGPPGADEARLRALASELGLGSRLRRLEAVSDSALAGLYRDALALCFPSVIEGFGLPVLEAMAAGTPVLASDIPTTRELAGPVAVYVEEREADAWAQAIDGLTSTPDLQARLAAGRLRAAEFTWERTARTTLAGYRAALGRASAPEGV